MKNRTFILFLIAILVITLSACQAAGPGAGGSEAPTEPTLLTAAEAEAIALEAAGVTEYTHLHTEFEVDDGVKEYEVDFRAGDWEYEYTVHAETGKILASDKEFDPPAQPDPTVPQTPEGADPVVTEPPAATEAPAEPTVPVDKPTEPPVPEYITAKKAENIALANAGLKREDVRFERTELDIDDGVPHYEVEFDYKGWEYDYEIHAVTGAVLDAPDETRPPDQEIIATDPVPTEPAADKLSAKEAEDIALKHAGLNRADVRFEQTEFDVDDGVPEYEIEFYVDGWEYSYEIHAETGKILSSEKDYDD